MLSRQSHPNGQSCSQVLKEWLHFGEYDLPSLHDCKEMVRDQAFLQLLYRRGIADFFPPILALQKIDHCYTSLDVRSAVTTIELKGSHNQMISIKTPPISSGRLTASGKLLKMSCGAATSLKLFSSSDLKQDSIVPPRNRFLLLALHLGPCFQFSALQLFHFDNKQGNCLAPLAAHRRIEELVRLVLYIWLSNEGNMTRIFHFSSSTYQHDTSQLLYQTA
ncbi:hypothetical protein COLO4_25587 [Corchorus olitorius]|uniref:Uncharacterized protein n=1 Tax=Corchorus olitorius TaxID=93759 RepID=A0A1R3I1A4_9ROSI|nr:hypothetical protein COLO4_25587 [Corchorus olitorius]